MSRPSRRALRRSCCSREAGGSGGFMGSLQGGRRPVNLPLPRGARTNRGFPSPGRRRHGRLGATWGGKTMSKKSTALLLLFALLAGPTAAPAQPQRPGDKPLPGDEMIYKYLCAETDKLSAKFLDGATTLQEWQKKRPRLHQEYLDMLGLWPLPEKTPLKATFTGKLEHEGVIIDNLHFQSKPGLYVTANLYRPKDPPAQKLPAILYVCGHSGKGRDGNKTAFQDHGMWFASNGYVCIILNTLQLGEIPGVHHGTYGTPWRHVKDKNKNENRFWWHSIGYSPAAVECWN